MADFCKQCSIELFGEDSKDLANLFKQSDYEDVMFIRALCEGCGGTSVLEDGTCINPDCLRKGHKENG